jgi:hypothetical protein
MAEWVEPLRAGGSSAPHVALLAQEPDRALKATLKSLGAAVAVAPYSLRALRKDA